VGLSRMPNRWRAWLRDRGPAVLAHRANRVIAIVAGVTGLSLLARALEPIQMGSSEIDSGLFVRLGSSLAHGQWLGSFDWLTLAKGPAYPALLAVSSRLDVPVKIAEQLTYLLAAACVALCIWVTTRQRTAAVLAYAVLALNPMNYGVAGAEIMRDGWYGSLALLFVASTFLAVHLALSRTRALWAIATGLLAGLSGAAFWLCREEGPWLVPSVAIIAFGLPALRVARWRFSEPRVAVERRTVSWTAGRYVAVLLAIGVMFAGPVAFVADRNHAHYGVALTNDSSAGQFGRAYLAWMRVQAGPVVRDVPINAQQRGAVYRVSPAARQLQPYLEGPRDVWLRYSCGHDVHCDLQGAFTEWALRSAALEAGHMRTARGEQRFFGQLADQIGAACHRRTLRCRSALPSALQRFAVAPPGAVAGSAGDLLGRALWPTSFMAPPTQRPAHLPPALRARAHALIPDVPSTPHAASSDVATFKRYDWPYRLLGYAYTLLLPVLLAGAVALAGLRLVRARRWPGDLVVLSVALLVGVAVRLVVLALVDVVEFDTTLVRYGLPVAFFLLTYGVIAVFPALRRDGIALVADAGQAHGEAQHHELDAGDDENHGGDGHPD
jgi:hypothetical protein